MKDWQRVPGVLTDRLVVKVSPRAVGIVFGQVGETEVSFHTAVVMTRRNAVALAEAIQKLSAKSKGAGRQEGDSVRRDGALVHSAPGTVAPWVTSGLRSAPVAKGIEADYLRRVARMGGRVVEGTGLENRKTRERFEGSNPSPSPIFYAKQL
jgi:hypothetical protein